MTSLHDAISRVLQQLLALDPSAIERAEALAPCCIGVTLAGFDTRFALVITVGTLAFESWPLNQIADVEIAGTPIALIRMAMNPADEAPILNGQVRVVGDAAKLQRLRTWLATLDLDLEEWFAQHVGDIAAHQGARAVRSFGRWVQTSGRHLRSDLAEYLVHEARIVPTQWEVRDWVGSIDLLRDDAARLESRLQLLEAALRRDGHA